MQYGLFREMTEKNIQYYTGNFEENSLPTTSSQENFCSLKIIGTWRELSRLVLIYLFSPLSFSLIPPAPQCSRRRRRRSPAEESGGTGDSGQETGRGTSTAETGKRLFGEDDLVHSY